MVRAGLVGRRPEMRSIEAALTAAQCGSGKAIFVIGEGGIGKSRLADEAIRVAAGKGMATSRGRASTVGPPLPYRPVIEALLALSRDGGLPDLDGLGPYGSALAGLLAGAGEGLPYILVAEAMLRLLGVLGERRGCLLVLDDLHDADPPTLAMVEYLLDNIGRQPVVLLLAARRDPRPAAALAARFSQHGTAEFVELRPFGRRDVHLLLAAELGLGPGEVSGGLVDYVLTGGTGLPLVAHELVGHLAHHDRDVVRTLPVSTIVAGFVRRRLARLGGRGRELLSLAAAYGPRFPLPVVQRATGRPGTELAATLRADGLVSLLRPDDSGPDWYAFRHQVAADTVLAQLSPTERTGHARRIALALAELHPDLPGEWCLRAAELYERAGDAAEAGRLYAEAGGRALAGGGTGAAVPLLLRAHRVLAGDPGPDRPAAVLDQLLPAAAGAGRYDLLPELTDGVHRLGRGGLAAPHQLRLHAQLASLATAAGRSAAATEQLVAARRLLGAAPADVDVAVVELAAAQVELHRAAPDRLAVAAGCARRGAAAAQRANRPALTGRARLITGHLIQNEDEPAARAALLDARAIAVEHQLPMLRVTAETCLAGLALRRDGDTDAVEHARAEALRLGALALVHEADAALGLERVWRGEFDDVGPRLREALRQAGPHGRALSQLRLVEAVAAAHRADRAGMLAALDRLDPHLDEMPGVRGAAYGLARAYCSLLEEDHAAAEQELAQAAAYDAENPSVRDFGQRGIVLLAGVLAGRLGRHHLDVVAAAASSEHRWNRQFVGMARAVLLGRDGRPAEANAAAADALWAGARYPTARSLCQRLVAPAAYEDGWGEPVDWLRQAETYCHDAGLHATAGASRVLLRRMGARVRQRRTGADLVPADLRRRGVTVREFEVARLLACRIGNKDIAGRLHISPRTVEKHVASILQKTGHPDRGAFAAAARDLALGPLPFPT